MDATGEALLDLLKKVIALSDKYIDISKEKEKLDLGHEKGFVSGEGTSGLGLGVDENESNPWFEDDDFIGNVEGNIELHDNGPELSDSDDDEVPVNPNNADFVQGNSDVGDINVEDINVGESNDDVNIGELNEDVNIGESNEDVNISESNEDVNIGETNLEDVNVRESSDDDTDDESSDSDEDEVPVEPRGGVQQNMGGFEVGMTFSDREKLKKHIRM